MNAREANYYEGGNYMKNRFFRWLATLALIAAISFPIAVTSQAKAQENNEASEQTQEMNCCNQMEMMKKEMQPMMESHKKTMAEMKSLFSELQQRGDLTPEQQQKMNNIEEMMKKMGEKMKNMASMEMK
jgi:uncharacterized protein HemX